MSRTKSGAGGTSTTEIRGRETAPLVFLRARLIRVALVVAFASLAAAVPCVAAAEETAAASRGGSPLDAVAPAAGAFGATGQWVYSLSDPAEFPFLLLKTGNSPWHVLIQPSADTFIAPNVSVGGLLKFERSNGTTDVGVGVRAGYDLHFTSLVSLWMRGGIFYNHYSVNNGPSGSNTSLDIKLPVLFHLVPHFFLGVGPTVGLPLQGGGDTTFGLGAIVGGYL